MIEGGEDAVWRGEDGLTSREARAAAAAAALRRRFLESESSCKDAEVLDDCAVQRAQAQRRGSTSPLNLGMTALWPGVAMHAAVDGLTGEDAEAAFRAGLLVRSMQGDAGDFIAGSSGSSEALANAVNGACSVDAHAESALAMMLVGANLPPGRNVYQRDPTTSSAPPRARPQRRLHAPARPTSCGCGVAKCPAAGAGRAPPAAAALPPGSSGFRSSSGRASKAAR